MLEKLKGETVTEWLRSFNNWRDDFLIEASTLMLIIGFMFGTVDILTQGGVATQGWFSTTWAIVQAIAIDGLFFAVWGKIARANWEDGQRRHIVAMVMVGLVLAGVAIAVNGVLGYQEITKTSDSYVAMQKLNIDKTVFTWVRASLVVAVAILVAIFCREKKATPAQITKIEELRSQSPLATGRSHSRRKATVIESHSQATVAIPEHSGIASGYDELATAMATVASQDSHSTGYVATDDGYAVADGDSQSMMAIATGSHRERIKMAMQVAMAEGREFTYVDIQKQTGVGYSTVKKHAPVIKKELEEEL